jgi:DnaJ-class molecular chaperone
MGFDLIGVQPQNKKGEYFRNNCWWWRPLWHFVATFCKDILTEQDIEGGSWNNGHRIDANKALKVAIRLEHLVNLGQVKAAVKEYKKALKALPLEKCEICNGTGQRNDKIVQGECNACRGKGKRKSWQTNYPFDEQNVKEFAEFCRNSGGFEIC